MITSLLVKEEVRHRENLERIGLTTLELEKEASRQFDGLKEKFEGPHSPLPHILIHSGSNAPPDARQWLVCFSNKDMQSFFQPVVNKIFECTDSLVTPRTKVCFMVNLK